MSSFLSSEKEYSWISKAPPFSFPFLSHKYPFLAATQSFQNQLIPWSWHKRPSRFLLRAHSLAGICLKRWQTVTKAVGQIYREKEKRKKASYTNAAAQLESFQSGTLQLLKATLGKIRNKRHSMVLSCAFSHLLKWCKFRLIWISVNFVGPALNASKQK